jgi:hypothetical protein
MSKKRTLDAHKNISPRAANAKLQVRIAVEAVTSDDAPLPDIVSKSRDCAARVMRRHSGSQALLLELA